MALLANPVDMDGSEDGSGVFGVDEAGRGPAIGSMFAAAVVVPDPGVLPDGIADSKQLTPDRREALAAALHADDRVAIGIGEVTSAEIDRPDANMNALTVVAHARALEGVVRPGLSGIVDACDTSAERFARRVTEAVSVDVHLRAEHRADESDPVVGAASVVAKVARDAHVADLAAEFGEVGSGYPSDPRTRSFLAEHVAEHGDLPACARRSWQTCKDVLAAEDQSALGDFARTR